MDWTAEANTPKTTDKSQVMPVLEHERTIATLHARLEQAEQKIEAEQRDAKELRESLTRCNDAFNAMEDRAEKAERERDEAMAEITRLKNERGAQQFDRDFLGQIVRMAWVDWAKTQPNPKPSWLVPWSELSETDKEADRQIGEAVANMAVSPELLRVEGQRDELRARLARITEAASGLPEGPYRVRWAQVSVPVDGIVPPLCLGEHDERIAAVLNAVQAVKEVPHAD